MKTVMKKIFSLMLVAVLLVSAVPFAASADSVPYYQVILASDNSQLACEGLEVGTSYSITSFVPSGYEYDFGQHRHADGSINELASSFQVVNGDVIIIAVKPASTTEPEETTKPTEPEETTKPTEPEETTKPTEPEETTKPTEPEETTKPTEPEETTEPTTPQTGNSNGNYNLKIYATMWTGDGREDTVYLGTFYNLTTNTKIANHMDQNSNTIHNWVAQVCSGYEWVDGKIYENKWSSDEIEWNDRMGYSDQEAYINVKRSSKDVVIFVHTARTYADHDWIKVEGKTTNDTLTLDEAKSIVKKYYKFSSLKMYSNDNWNEYVDGNNNIQPQNAVAIGSGNVTKIHVLITGASANSSSGTNSGSNSTADSSNPKTGDEIYAPVMILGLSASALAVLFYLNKKRAF